MIILYMCVPVGHGVGAGQAIHVGHGGGSVAVGHAGQCVVVGHGVGFCVVGQSGQGAHVRGAAVVCSGHTGHAVLVGIGELDSVVHSGQGGLVGHTGGV